MPTPQFGAPGGNDDSQEMPTCSHCGSAIWVEHAADCPVLLRPVKPEPDSAEWWQEVAQGLGVAHHVQRRRANALRDALCAILSATGAVPHEIPRLAKNALTRDNELMDGAAPVRSPMKMGGGNDY